MTEQIDRIVKFIQETVEGARATGVVLGLSGGLDSAVVAYLCVKALGEEKCHFVSMPHAKGTDNYVLEITSGLNSRLDFYDISFVVDLFPESTMFDRIATGNIKARIRMVVLYYYANQGNKLVVGTTNKSELEIGYFTKYGDGGVDFEPIAHLYKTDIYKLAKELGVPQEIIDRKPSADLWKGQTDEDEIGMDYETLDDILRMDSQALSIRKYGADKTARVMSLVENSEHKRRLPPNLIEEGDE